MKQLITLKKEYEQKGYHLQRIYCRRRKDKEGHIRSSFSKIMERPTWQF